MSGVSPDFAAYEAKEAAFWVRYLELLPANKAALFDALAAAGVGTVVVTFDGSSDEGQIESVAAFDTENGEVELPAGQVEQHEASFDTLATSTVLRTLHEVIETMGYNLLSQTHDGWENGEGAYGDFTFSLAERSVTLEYNERYTTTTCHQHAF